MRALIQRVKEAEVEVGARCISKIGEGLLVLVAIAKEDTEQTARKLAQKILNLRVFRGKNEFDQSVLDCNGELLIVSQFTLYGDTSAGRRPDFSKAAKAEYAKEIYKKFIQLLKDSHTKVKEGIFGEYMLVNSVNDGPVSLIIEA